MGSPAGLILLVKQYFLQSEVRTTVDGAAHARSRRHRDRATKRALSIRQQYQICGRTHAILKSTGHLPGRLRPRSGNQPCLLWGRGTGRAQPVGIEPHADRRYARCRGGGTLPKGGGVQGTSEGTARRGTRRRVALPASSRPILDARTGGHKLHSLLQC